jgi:hypothetical protein
MVMEGPDRQFARDPEDYWISVFGTPSMTGTWGWRWEGHHLSLHFTIVAGRLTVSTPTFMASNPARVTQGPRAGLQALRVQEESARSLLGSLTPEQRRVTIFQEENPRDIVTGAVATVTPLDPAGIRASALNGSQRDLLMGVVDAYVGVMNDDIARVRMDRIREAGIENITFGWAGGTEVGQLAYYRVQGPTFLIEFDNTMNDPNHIHTTFRDFEGDLGRDVLREHIQASH